MIAEGSGPEKDGTHRPTNGRRETLTASELARLSGWLDMLAEIPPESRHAWLRTVDETSAAVLDALWLTILEEHKAAQEGRDSFLTPLPERLVEKRSRLPEPQPGDSIGPYLLIDRIGQGGMGVVWRAHRQDVMRSRIVALKLPEDLGSTEAERAQIAHEGEMLAQLSHPGIARLYDANLSPEGRPYLAIEYIDGQGLVEYIRSAHLDIDGRIELFLLILDALGHAHEKGIAHLDLKPGNIQVDRQGRPVLLDFGISRLLTIADRSHLKSPGPTPVTLAYASPELLAGEEAGKASDIYSLGVLLYETLAGSRPYDISDLTAPEMAARLRSTVPTPPSTAALAAPGLTSTGRKRLSRRLKSGIDEIIVRAMHSRAEERYNSVSALYAELESVLAVGPRKIAKPRTLRGVLASLAPTFLVASLIGGLLWVGVDLQQQSLRAPSTQAVSRNGASENDLSLEMLAESIARPGTELGTSSEGRIGIMLELLERIRRKNIDPGTDFNESSFELYKRLADIFLRAGRTSLVMQVHDLRISAAQRAPMPKRLAMLTTALEDAIEACQIMSELAGGRCTSLADEARAVAASQELDERERTIARGRIELSDAYASAFDLPDKAEDHVKEAARLLALAKESRYQVQMHVIRAIILGTRRKWNASLAELRAAGTGISPSHPWYPVLQANLCEAQHRLGDLRAAESTCSAAMLFEIQNRPEFGATAAWITYQLAAVYLSIGHFDRARQVLMEGIQRMRAAGNDTTSEQFTSMFELAARVELAWGDFDEAAVWVAKFPAPRPGPLDAWACSFANIRASLARRRGSIEDSTVTSPAASLVPPTCDELPSLNQVERHMERARWGDALRLIQQIRATDQLGTHSEAVPDTNLRTKELQLSIDEARILLGLDRRRDAMALTKLLQKSIQTSPEPAMHGIRSMELSELRGRLLLADGDVASAQSWLADALRTAESALSPKSPDRLRIHCHAAHAKYLAGDAVSTSAMLAKAEHMIQQNGGQLSDIELESCRRLKAEVHAQQGADGRL